MSRKAKKPSQAASATPPSRWARAAEELVRFHHGGASAAGVLHQLPSLIGRTSGAYFTLLHARLASQVITGSDHQGTWDPGFWKPAVERFLNESLVEGVPRTKLLSAKKAALKVVLLFAPLRDAEGAVLGGVATAVKAAPNESSSLLERLQMLLALAASLMDVARKSATDDRSKDGSAAAWVHAAKCESPEEFAISLTNNLRNRLDCEQVALGWVRGSRCAILSVSGLDEPLIKSPSVARIRAAMEECMDAGVPLAAPPLEDASGREHRLHKQWRDLSRGAAVATAPIMAEGRCVAVVGFRRSVKRPFTLEELQHLQAALVPYSAMLPMLRRATRSILGHAKDAALDFMRLLAGTRGREKTVPARVTALTVLLAGGWIAFGTLPYELVAPCVITPDASRIISAPFEGRLIANGVKPGDQVVEGQVLGALDARSLALQKKELEAELAIAGTEQLKALAMEEHAEAKLAEQRAQWLRVRIMGIERRLDEAEFRSPCAGVVVSRDLDPRVNDVIVLGEPLYQIAEPRGWRVEISVSERTLADLAPGAPGVFAPKARPEEQTPIRVDRLRPRAEVRDGRNVIVVEARMSDQAAWMRPGMEGFVQIGLGRRPVWWVATHKVLDYLRLNFWI